MTRPVLVAATAALLVAATALSLSQIAGSGARPRIAPAEGPPVAAGLADAGPAAVAFTRRLLACPTITSRVPDRTCGVLTDIATAASPAGPHQAVVLLTATMHPPASSGRAPATDARESTGTALPLALRLQLAWRAGQWVVLGITGNGDARWASAR